MLYTAMSQRMRLRRDGRNDLSVAENITVQALYLDADGGRGVAGCGGAGAKRAGRAAGAELLGLAGPSGAAFVVRRRGSLGRNKVQPQQKKSSVSLPRQHMANGFGSHTKEDRRSSSVVGRVVKATVVRAPARAKFGGHRRVPRAPC